MKKRLTFLVLEKHTQMQENISRILWNVPSKEKSFYVKSVKGFSNPDSILYEIESFSFDHQDHVIILMNGNLGIAFKDVDYYIENIVKKHPRYKIIATSLSKELQEVCKSAGAHASIEKDDIGSENFIELIKSLTA